MTVFQPSRFVPALFASLTVGLVASIGVAAAQDDEPVESAEFIEMSEVIEGIECPDLGIGDVVVNENRPPRMGSLITADGAGGRVTVPPSDITVECEYLDPDVSRTFRIGATFSFRAEPNPRQCTAEPSEERSNPARQRVGLGILDDDVAIAGEYLVGQDSLDDHGRLVDEIVDGIGRIAEQVREYALECQLTPVEIACPAIAGHEGTLTNVPTAVDLILGACNYETTDESFGSASLNVRWATPRSTRFAKLATCEDSGVSPVDAVGSVGGDGTAAEVRWFVAPGTGVELDSGPVIAAAVELREQVLEQSAACPKNGVISTWTDLPPYLAEVYAPARIDAPLPPWGGAALASVESGGAASGDGAVGGVATPGATGTATVATGGRFTTLLRIAAILGLVLSLVGLVVALLLVRRETRIRPRLDAFRIVIVVGVAVLSMIIFSRAAPLWAVVPAVGGGLVLGWLQGRNLSVRVDGDKILAKRGMIAILAFAAGLIATQVAGLANRTGVVSLGVALSFLSAAVTAGLIAGRQPKLVQARQIRGAMIAVLVGGAVVSFSVALAPETHAQESDGDEPVEVTSCTNNRPGERCAATELLIDMVEWDEIEFNGGLFWLSGKPFTTLAVPRGLDTPPADISRIVEWEANDTEFSVDEIFTFSLDADGLCCSVDYDATGTRVFTEDRIDEWVAQGPLEDIEPIGDFVSGGFVTRAAQSGVPFDEGGFFQGEPEDACHRAVGGTHARGFFDDDATLPVHTKDGEDERLQDAARSLVFAAPCELEDFNAENALALAGDGPTQTMCPTRAELLPALASEEFPAEAVQTLGPLFTEPHEEWCRGGSLSGPIQLGSGARGATRSEFAFEFNTPETRTAWGDDSALRDVARPSSIAPGDRCETNDAGQVKEIDPADQCELISMHEVDDDGSWVWVYVDNSTFDGPNVTIRAALPWGTYWYNCHHCSPESPEVARVLGSFHDATVEWIDGAVAGGVPDDAEQLTPTSTTAPELVDDLAFEDDAAALGIDSDLVDLAIGDRTDPDARNAALAALVGLLGAAGVLGLGIAESGATATEIADAFRSGGRRGLDRLLDDRSPEPEPTETTDQPPEPDKPEPERVSTWDPRIDNGLDEEGNPLPPGGFVMVSVAERDRLEALDRAQRSGETQDRLADERAEREAEIREHDEAMIAIENEAIAEVEAEERAERLADIQAEQEYWDNPINWLSEFGSDFTSGVLNDFYELGRFDFTESGWPITLEDNPLYQAARGIGQSIRDVLDAIHGAVNSEAAWDAIHWGVTEGVPETFVGTLRDATGLVFGVDEAYDHLVEGMDSITGGTAAAAGFVYDNFGTLLQALTGLDRLAASADPDKPLAERLENYGSFAAEVFITWATWGSGTGATSLVDEAGELGRAARAGERLEDASDVGRAARNAEVENFLAQVEGRPGRLTGDAFDERRAAWAALQANASRRVDRFESALEDLARARRAGNADDVAAAEARARRAMLDVQGDKRALQEINYRSNGTKGAYNDLMQTSVLRPVDDDVVRALARNTDGFDADSMTDMGHFRKPDGTSDPTITVYMDKHGNQIHLASPTNPSSVPKVGADRDFTARLRRAGSSRVDDVPHEKLRPMYETALRNNVADDARALGLPDDAASLAQRLDHEITSGFHLESYTDLETILYNPGGKLQDPEQIRLAMRYKGEHWMQQRVAEASKTAGRNVTEAEIIESFVAEGMRQTSKQFGNQVVPRFEEANKLRLLAKKEPLVMPKRLQDSFDILARVNPKPPVKPSLSPVEAERLLFDLNTSPSKFADEMGAFLEMVEKGKGV